MKKFFKILLISIFLFLVIDFSFGENLLKIIQLTTNFNSSIAIKDENQYYVFKNNENIILTWAGKKYNFCTNEIGLKTSCKENLSLKKIYKYAFIGDSFTEGIGVEYDKTFVGLFNDNNDTLNLGISGHSPFLYLKRLKFYSEKISFDNLVLFLDLTDFEDDYGWHTQGSKYIEFYNIDENKELLKKKLEHNFKLTYVFLRNLWWIVYLPNLDLNKIYLHDDKRWSWDYLPEENIKNYNFKQQLYLKNISEIINYCLIKKIKLHIIIFPHPGTLINMKDISISKQNNLIRSLCDNNNCNFLSLYPNFFEEKITSDLIIKKYYINYDIHFNEQGHYLIYKILKEKFR
jgi:hypothetical protein